MLTLSTRITYTRRQNAGPATGSDWRSCVVTVVTPSEMTALTPAEQNNPSDPQVPDSLNRAVDHQYYDYE